MISAFWNNINKRIPMELPDAAAVTGVLHQVIDLQDVYNRGDVADVEVEVVVNGISPGSGKNLTCYAAFCSRDNRSPVELATAALSQAFVLPDATSTRRLYMMQLLYQGARYLHIWFDKEATTAGSALALEVTVNAKIFN